MKTNSICILGSTGSIGTQAISICKALNIKIAGISACSNIKLAEAQIRELKPEFCHIYNKDLGKELKIKTADTNTVVLYGEETLNEFVSNLNADTLLTSVIGSIGLLPTVAAINKGMKIALANKETLVAAGKIIINLAKQKNVPILPVDSEHSAIFQCLEGNNRKELKNIILTASGGPFFGKKKNELLNITKADALKHPNWSMGAKITVDSATMMNKGLEVIEARWLFDTLNIKVVIHRESIIHSMVEYEDNSVIAQLGLPDMKIPIQYALTYPERFKSLADPIDFYKLSKLTFDKPDSETFGCLNLAFYAAKEGGSMPLCLNAANEVAVGLFLKDKIKFLMIEEIIKEMLGIHKNENDLSLDECLLLDKEIKQKTMELAERKYVNV